MQIKKCTKSERGAVYALADEVFLKSRGREGDLLQAFPSVFEDNTNCAFFAAMEGNRAVSAAIYKPYPYILNGRLLTGATVGFVCTDPDYRGRGLSSQIMQLLAEDMAQYGVDFAVLYTGIPQFYARLGWVLGDDTAYCESASLQKVGGTARVQPISPQQADYNWLEGVRAKHLKQRVLRTEIDYLTIPLPAREVRCFTLNTADTECYALIGINGTAGYLYEMVGDSAGFGALWNSLIDGLESFFVNDRIGSESYKWMQQNNLLEWSERLSAMWLEVPGGLPEPQNAGIHVHFFDHI